MCIYWPDPFYWISKWVVGTDTENYIFFLPGHQVNNGIFSLLFQLLKFLVFLTTDSSELLPSFCLLHLQTNWERLPWPSLRNISRAALNELSNRGTLVRKIFNWVSKLNSMQCIFISRTVFYCSYKFYMGNF